MLGRMLHLYTPRVIASDMNNGGIIITFDNGNADVFSANLLYETLLRSTLPILLERNEKIRARAIAHIGRDKLSEPDRLDAVYLDDALSCSSAREHAVWALILFVGGTASRCRAAASIRYIVWRACFYPAQISGMESMITI